MGTNYYIARASDYFNFNTETFLWVCGCNQTT